MAEGRERSVVAHLIATYLFVTGSWIHGQLTHLRRYRAVVVARRLQNLATFPFSPVHSLQDCALPERTLTRLAEVAFSLPLFQLGVIRKEHVCLLHAHFGPEGYYALKLRRRCGRALITTFYGYDVSQLPRVRRWRRRYEHLFAEGDLFLVEGHHMRRRLMELGCPPEKVRVQHLGVDTETIAFHPRQAPPDGTVRVLMAASFREKKGLSDGLRAFAEVFARYPRMELTIMGDANPNSVAEMNLKKELEAIARARALRGVVHFLGYQPHSVFLSQLQASHIFMQPSVTAADGDTEGGAPVSIIEAQASGAPVIATYHADIPEVVLDEESGFLVPEKDVSALAERLEYLASHPRAWSWLGRAGRTHVESQYDLRTQVCKLEEVYDGFIRQRPR